MAALAVAGVSGPGSALGGEQQVGHDKQVGAGASAARIHPADLTSRSSIGAAYRAQLLPHNSRWAAARAGSRLQASAGSINAAFDRVVSRTAEHFADDGKPVASAVERLAPEAIGGHAGYVIARIAAELGIERPSTKAIRRVSDHLRKVAASGSSPGDNDLLALAEDLAIDLAPENAVQRHQIRSKLRDEGWMLGQYGWADFDTAMSASFSDALHAVRAELRLSASDERGLAEWITSTPLSKMQRAIGAPSSRVEELAAVVAAGAHLAYAQTKGHQARMEIAAGKSGKSGKAEDRLRAPEIAPYAEVLAISDDSSDPRIIQHVAALDLFGVLGAMEGRSGASSRPGQAKTEEHSLNSSSFGLSREIASRGARVEASDRVGSRGLEVSVVAGDITQMPVDALVVPHFSTAASWGGVGAAVARAGAGDAITAYENLLSKTGARAKWGDAQLTRSANAPWAVINVTSVGSERSQEFEVVARSVYAALVQARRAGAKSIAIPLLGTGVIGQLQAKQSARAMLGAIARFEADALPDQPLPKVVIVAFRDPQGTKDVAEVLTSKLYSANPSSEDGSREFDASRWVTEMRRDWVEGPGNREHHGEL